LGVRYGKYESERERERDIALCERATPRALPSRAAHYHGGAKRQEGQNKSLFWPSLMFKDSYVTVLTLWVLCFEQGSDHHISNVLTQD